MSTSVTSVPKNKPKTRKQKINEAFVVATRGLAKDIPILIQGALSGGLHSSSSISNHDEIKNKFDSELSAVAARDTHQLIAALTVQYIHKLVDAALDVRDMQLFGDSTHYNDMRQLLPPPPLENLNQPRINSKVDDMVSKSNQRKRNAGEVCYWDKAIPKPKIRGRPDPKVVAHDQQTQLLSVNPDQWVGVTGLDMWQNSRARAAYTQHRSISAQHFIFPLCHDSYVYGRIREMQAAKLSVIEPLLHDTTIYDVIRTEGRLQREEMIRKRRRVQRDKKSKKKVNNVQNSDDDSDNDPDDDSDSDDEDGPTWPGLDQLLPINRLNKSKH